jgi:hypothetical protein
MPVPTSAPPRPSPFRFAPRSVLAGLLALALVAPVAAQQVWVVDDNGGLEVQFTDIQPAIDAATSGDTILVRGGTYAAFVMDGKGLNLVQDGPGATRSLGGVIRNVDSDAVVIQGIDLDVGPGGLAIEDVSAPVWIENCVVSGAPAAVSVAGGAAVLVVDCDLQGFAGAAGLDIVNGAVGRVSVYRTIIAAGATPSDFSGSGTPGAPGIALNGGRLVISGSFVSGGKAGNGTLFCAGPAGPPPPSGGAGLRVQSGNAFTLDTAFLGGAGASQVPDGPCPPGPPGPSGLGVDVGSAGSVTNGVGQAVTLQVDSPVRVGEDTSLSLMAVATGAPTFLLISPGQEHTVAPNLNGTLFVAPAGLAVFPLGAFPQNDLQLVFKAPRLPVGSAFQPVQMQAALMQPGGTVLSSPALVLVLSDRL